MKLSAKEKWCAAINIRIDRICLCSLSGSGYGLPSSCKYSWLALAHTVAVEML